MLLEITKTQEIEITKEFKSTFTIFDLDDLIFLCICNHLDTGHINCIGKCDYDLCDCEKFEQKDFEMEIIITKADVFSYENPDLEYDSPQFWLKLGEKLDGDNININYSSQKIK